MHRRRARSTASPASSIERTEPKGATRPILCLVVDRGAARLPLVETVEAAFSSGADWLQLRDRELEGADWFRWCLELVAAALRGAAGARVTAVINRRIDIALALRAEPGPERPLRIGVHLGFDAVGVSEARALLGAAAPIGVSAHASEEVAVAARAGASYAHLAPIFDPLSKETTRPPLGREQLAAASRHGLPLLAQGGIDADRCGAVLDAGAAGVAVTGTILAASDPAAATRELRAALDRRRGPRRLAGGASRAPHEE